METTGLHAAETPLAASQGRAAPHVAAEVASFCDSVRAEHLRFLQAVGDARARLGHDHSELAKVAAIHGRLTRQFFDAQRSILLRRAEVDAEIDGIARQAEANAATVAADARRRAAMLAHPSAGDPSPDLLPAATEIPFQLAPMASEANELAVVLDQMFMPREAEGVVEQRELANLLDCWWAAEQQEARARIDDANARAAMRRHVAVVEAATIASHHVVAVAQLEAAGACCGRLPPRFTDVLDAAVAENLDAVLDTLIALLVAQPLPVVPLPANAVVDSPTVATPLKAGAILRFEPTPVFADETFQTFWEEAPAAVATDAARPRLWQRVAFVVSAAAASSSLFIVSLWWIG